METLIMEIIGNLVIPTFEEYKKAFLDEIKREGINDDKQYIVEEVFNPDSEIYESEYTFYELNEILSQINRFYGNRSLYTEMNSDYGIICDLVDKLNPAIQDTLDTCAMELFDEYHKKFSEDKDFEVLAEEYRERLEKELSIEELKAFILAIIESKTENPGKIVTREVDNSLSFLLSLGEAE